MTATKTKATPSRNGPTFAIDIEGSIYPWDEPTITVSQIRELGGLPADVPVLMINLRSNEERTLAEDEVIKLKPGLGFSKSVEFRRG